jgi:hypothetical protein
MINSVQKVNPGLVPQVTQSTCSTPTTQDNTINNDGVKVKITDSQTLELAKDLYSQYKSLYFNNPKDPNIQTVSAQFSRLVGMPPRPPLKEEMPEQKQGSYKAPPEKSNISIVS